MYALGLLCLWLILAFSRFRTKVRDVTDLLDPSDKYRPDHKDQSEFRNYTEGRFIDRVRDTFYNMHKHQSYQFATDKVRAPPRGGP